MKKIFVAIVVVAMISGVNSSCTKDNTTIIPLVYDSVQFTANFSTTASYTLYSLQNKAIVPLTDSASNKWDFGMKQATMIINSNASGPGNAGVQLLDAVFSTYQYAPITGYAYDTTVAKKAIPAGSWYDYVSATRSFVPKVGKLFVFRTANNKYAKMEILKADYGAIVGNQPTTIIYTLRIIYQPDGTANLQ
jgi:hypothetical protein